LGAVLISGSGWELELEMKGEMCRHVFEGRMKSYRVWGGLEREEERGGKEEEEGEGIACVVFV